MQDLNQGVQKYFQDKIKLVKKILYIDNFFPFPNTPWTMRKNAMVHYLQSLLAVGVQIFFSFSPQKKVQFNFVTRFSLLFVYLLYFKIAMDNPTCSTIFFFFLKRRKERIFFFFFLNEQENFSKQNTITNKSSSS